MIIDDIEKSKMLRSQTYEQTSKKPNDDRIRKLGEC
jgi:hypothetical protein